MIIEQNFFKNIPLGYDIIVKLLNFEKQLLEAQNQIRELPLGYRIRKVNNTNIFKFRLNNSDRILFTFIKSRQNVGNDIVFLSYVNHDAQIRKAHNYNVHKIKLLDISVSLSEQEYQEDATDKYIEKIYHKSFDLSSFKGFVINEKDLEKIIVNEQTNFAQYLSHEQFDVLKSMENQILLTGAGGTGKTIVLLHILSLVNVHSSSLYLTYTDLLLEKAQQDYQIFKENNNLEFITVRKLLSKLSNIDIKEILTTNQIRSWLKAEKYKYRIIQIKEIHEIVAEIRGVLTGYLGLEYIGAQNKIKNNQKLLSLDSYLNIPKQYSIFNKEEKEEIYKVALAYQKWIKDYNQYDENDIAGKILKSNNLPMYDYIVVDEIQDLSELQIYLISKLIKPNGKIVWAGDTNQTIYPTFFNFGRLKNLYFTYEQKLICKVLTKNYRGTRQITNLINEIVKCRQLYIGKSTDDCTEVALKDGSIPKILDFKENEFTFLFNELLDKHYCVVVVGSENTRKNLIQKYKGLKRRIFLIHEIKGLEYDNVYCYDLMSEYSEHWNEILNYKHKKNNHMKYYFNLLYVGISRAKSNLFIYESKYKELNFKPFEICEIVKEYNLEIVALTQKSTAKDWENEAKRLEQVGQTEQSQLAREYAQEAEINEKNEVYFNDTLELEDLIYKANNGDIDAQFNLGMCYKKGIKIKIDAQKAVEWYTKAALQGHAQAQYNLGICYTNSDGIVKDLKWHYGNGAQQSLKIAVEWYTKSAMQGYAPAQYSLGSCYDEGIGVNKNLAKAMEWYQKAAVQRYAPAQYSLGLCYELEKDLKKAIELWQEAANQEHALAQFKLAECYDNGYDIERDFHKAAQLWEKAAIQEQIEAQFKIGLCYKKGDGVEKDLTKAIEWFQKSAMHGYAPAQYSLGLEYTAIKDFHKAVEMYKKAAIQGHIDAQFRLGICLEEGKGTRKDIKQAIKWYRKASAKGHRAAQFYLDMLKNIK
ncbi:hypothetical protein AN641_00640 [Candidatus Epulonipiscioides gigas]|nr:hypothetical protein AN641_00640 [Epulopiscium sp. SCG-C07WGA-EpuloA2]